MVITAIGKLAIGVSVGPIKTLSFLKQLSVIGILYSKVLCPM